MANGRMINPNFTANGVKDYHWDLLTKGLPTLKNCDLAKPTERFLWALVALPGVNGGQLVMPCSYNMAVSEHLCEVGAMLKCPDCGHEEPKVKKYQLPTAQDPHWMTSPGSWVAPDAPENEPHPARTVLSRLSAVQKTELLELLLEERERDGAEGEGPQASEPEDSG